MDNSQNINAVRSNRTVARYLRVFVLISGVVAFAVGLSSFAGLLSGPEESSCSAKGFNSALLMTLQLYVLNISADELCGFGQWSAAFIAPLATIGALLAVFFQNIETLWRRLCLKVRMPEVVFLGGGNNATSIALHKYQHMSGSTKAKENVVVIDSAATPMIHAHIPRLDCKVCDWQGDALSGDVLRNTNTIGAKHVWVMTGDDKRNLEIAQNLTALRKDKNKPESQNSEQMIMVNVEDQELIRDASFAIGDLTGIRFFSLKQLASRYMLLQYNPQLPPLVSKNDDDTPSQQLHIAIIGSGDMVEAIVEQAIVHFVYSDDPAACLRITLFGEDANVRLANFNRRLPTEADGLENEQLNQLLPIVQLHAVDCTPSRIRQSDWKSSQSELAFAVVYVNDDIDLNTVAWAVRAASLRELEGQTQQQKIVACLSQPSHDHAAFNVTSGKQLPENVEQFSAYDCIGCSDTYPGETQDVEAMLINLAYQVNDVNTFQQMTLLAARVRAREKWSGSALDTPLEEVYRRSSRFSADHIIIKIVQLYPELAGEKSKDIYKKASALVERETWSTDTGKPPGDQVMKLMKLEHRRFVVERLLDGWLPVDAPIGDDKETEQKTQRNKALRLNDTLIPFDDLPPYQKLKDQLIVECIPKILEIRSQRESEAEQE